MRRALRASRIVYGRTIAQMGFNEAAADAVSIRLSRRLDTNDLDRYYDHGRRFLVNDEVSPTTSDEDERLYGEESVDVSGRTAL